MLQVYVKMRVNAATSGKCGKMRQHGGKCGNSRQVLHDYKERVKYTAAEVEQDRQTWSDKIAAFLSEQGGSFEAERTTRVANYKFLRAVDHSLQAGLNLSLHAFIPKHPLSPLLADKRRYMVPKDQLPDQLCAQGQASRSCIEHVVTKHRRLELVGPVPRSLPSAATRAQLVGLPGFGHSRRRNSVASSLGTPHTVCGTTRSMPSRIWGCR